jgi:PAS domain S-box-containing protein
MLASQRPTFSNFLLPLGLAILVVLACCGALYLREAHQIESTTLDNESRRIDRFGALFKTDVASVVSDLRQLATGDGLEAYLLSGNPADLQRALRRAIFYSKDNPNYDQIRYLDENGQEVLRIERNGDVVPREQLQNKSDRSYFRQALALGPGQILVSTIDLNQEHGQIERPFKPTLRLAVPVYDANGQRHGIYIINFLVGNSFDQIRQYVARFAQRLRILNEQGYWLAGSRPEDEWGFMLPDRAGKNLAKSDPELWAKILQTPVGQAPYHGGYFTWSRVDLSQSVPDKPVTLVSDDKFLVFASVVTPEEWAASLVQLRQTFVVVALLLVALTTFACWFFQQRRRAQQERDRFFSLTRDLLCIAGFDGRLRRVNPAWEKALGYTQEEILSRPYLEFVHPDDREKTVLENNRLALGVEVASFENRYRCKDGTYRWFLWSARPLPEERLIYASARDTTERRQIEERLRQSDERARLMVESMKDYAIFMLAPDGKVMSWNTGAERIKGYQAEEIIGQHFSRFYPPEKIAEKFPDLELIEAASRGRFENEGWLVRKDGSRFWANDVITPMHNNQGELIGFVKVTRDVTARQEAAERIQKLNDELKSRATLLEAANKELESFSYSVSHDLRAPLRHIHGFVELLQKSPELEGSEPAQRQMSVIAKAAREMGMLIDDLLAFSRTGRAEMRLVPVDMQELVEQGIRAQEMETAGRQVEWDIKPLATVEGDPGLLRQVWANLLGNAIKYTRPRAQAKIEIGQEAGEPALDGTREAVFYVRDNGVGFDMRYASKLFGVFQRLHRAEDFEGTGIGLANVQRIIHRHGGKVWAESTLNEGSIFHFSLPVRATQHTNHQGNGKN